jgi:hypothetical protein
VDLSQLHAFAVEPMRTTDLEEAPAGGRVEVTAALGRVLDRANAAARFDTRTRVAFRVPPDTRTNEVRDLLLSYGFGDNVEADQAAAVLAGRLAHSMDQRTPAGLFIMAASPLRTSCLVFLWLFPRDQAFRFRSGPKGATLQVLSDVFSQTSHLRKGALFQGRKQRNEFLLGRVLDFQVRLKTRVAADYWIEDFLMCNLGTHGDSGTRLVARAFRSAFDALSDSEDQRDLFSSMMAVRRADGRRWTINELTEEYLDGAGRAAFLDAIPQEDTRTAAFEFQTVVFDEALKFRVFQLDTGVFVSTPFGEVGRSVVVEEKGERKLRCEGQIVGETVKRHAA